MIKKMVTFELGSYPGSGRNFYLNTEFGLGVIAEPVFNIPVYVSCPW